MFKKHAVNYFVFVILVKSGLINKELVLQMDNKPSKIHSIFVDLSHSSSHNQIHRMIKDGS